MFPVIAGLTTHNEPLPEAEVSALNDANLHCVIAEQTSEPPSLDTLIAGTTDEIHYPTALIVFTRTRVADLVSELESLDEQIRVLRQFVEQNQKQVNEWISLHSVA